MKALETAYAGCRFRSRLEARWAVFFDTMNIKWVYESEGYDLPSGWYLPDFLLTQCGTFIEVRGDPTRVDAADLERKGQELPLIGRAPGCDHGPRLMLLGHIPPPSEMDWGWHSFDADGDAGLYGFNEFHKNHRPWWFWEPSSPNLIEPTLSRDEPGDVSAIAYSAARSERFGT